MKYLHKKYNKKARKVSKLKKASGSDKPKKVSELIDDPSEVGQKPKKANGKKTATKTGKKVKKTPQPKNAPRTPEFVDTDPDDSDDEQGRTAKLSQKASKALEFVDTGMDVEQERQPKKAPKTPEYSDDEQGSAVNYQRCMVTYSTEDGQESVVKQLQKASKMPKFVNTSSGTEDEQEPTVKQPQKA